MTTSPAPQKSRITSTPDVCGGDACIRDTRIMVWLLVFFRRRGRSDAELLADYPSLIQDDLDAAWDYYRRNPTEIEQAIWLHEIADNQPLGVPVPAAALIYGRLVGLSDTQIREAFDPPLAEADLDAAWEEYRRHPNQIDQQIARFRLVA
jgi:uncharacterized protein (DUF433 family)